MDLSSLVLALGVGVVAGFLGTLLGIGGGSIIVPLLVLLGYDIKVVVPASLVAILGTSIGGLRYLFSHGLVDYKLAITLETASISGALAGVELFGRLSSGRLVAVLAITLILLSFYFAHRGKKIREEPRRIDGSTRSLSRLGAALTASFVAGMLSAMLGIGGGVVKVPILVFVLGLAIHSAVATSKLMVGITALTGVIGHMVYGHIDWWLAIALAIGTYLGATVSARILVKLEPRLVYYIASTYYAAVGTYLGVKAIYHI
ncbi:MAG: sulfite exporter TauE/SafE family protein [Pyrodictiaceae archaeon]